MVNKTFHITTYGCQMNEHDSETIAGMLLERGYTRAESQKDADIVIFNTCSIRENADNRFLGTLGQLKKRKVASLKDLTICVCGCMMQQPQVVAEMKEKFPWVDVIFGTHNIHEFPELLEKYFERNKRQRSVWDEHGEIVEGLPCDRLFRHKAFVNIMYGCNNFCTYCIVPYTRGRERSRKPEDIVNEVRRLADDGVREVMLLGQNVNSYRGVDAKGAEKDFTDLIYMLNEIEGLDRIRFMTSHPKDLSDKLIQAFVDCPKLSRWIHLPMQAGSSAVLKRMNRRYTREQYLELVRKLRAAVPDIAISTDIIVGFPGETEEDFQQTLSLCEEVRYDSAFTFMYSIRKGTPAEKYEDQIPEEIKHERFDRLVETVNRISIEKNAAYVGRTEEILVDGPGRNGEETFGGRTDTFKLVNFEGSAELVGKKILVKITDSNTFSLVGEVVSEV